MRTARSSTLFPAPRTNFLALLAAAAIGVGTAALPAAAGTPGVSVRQGGGGEETGLFMGIDGPAALFNLQPAAGAQFKNIAGVRSAPDGGSQVGYVGGVGRLQLNDATAIRVNYIGDEYSGEAARGAAGEARISTKVQNVKLGLSETINRGFEGPWTGHGDGLVTNATEAWASWGAFSNLALGGGVRRSHHYDGTEVAELNLNQSLGVAGGWLSNAMASNVADPSGAIDGTLSFTRPLLGLTSVDAGIDYAVESKIQPTTAHFGAQGPLGDDWWLYATAIQPLSYVAPARLDGGINGKMLGLNTNAYAGVGTDGAGYVGVRLTLPLSATPRRERWVGF